MAEEILNDSFPDLKELESKIGRKTPESLLMWMRDAADCEDGWRSDVVDRGDHSSDSLSDKVNSLKEEMRWLRCADVRILRQLLAVHEGIEALRWLMEERGTLTSRGSSLTGSLSSLVTVEEHGSMSPCRESPSPPCTQDSAETAFEESADQRPAHTDGWDLNHNSDFGVLTSEFSDTRSPSSSSSKFIVSRSARGSHSQASLSPANSSVSADVAQSQPQDSDAAPLQVIRGGADPIRRALLRSSRARGEPRAESGSFPITQRSGETHTVHQAPESLTAPQTDVEQEEESAASGEKALLGYDAQWCWVESQDDVTFL